MGLLVFMHCGRPRTLDMHGVDDFIELQASQKVGNAWNLLELMILMHCGCPRTLGIHGINYVTAFGHPRTLEMHNCNALWAS